MPAATATPPPHSAVADDPFGAGDLPAPNPDGRRLPINWVSLDARTGRLCCPRLNLEVDQFIGRITEKRLVRVFGGGMNTHDAEEDGVLCASDNRWVADHGRPGRECETCEERHASCTPRWRIVWDGQGVEVPGCGLAFAHTLSGADTVAFTRYALALRRDGLRPCEALTRIYMEGLRHPGGEKIHWRLRFEKVDDEG